MAWSDPVDPTTPADTDPASEGDDHFRSLKRALNERLGSRLVGWPEADPLPLRAFDVGDIDDRPAEPAGDGHVFVAHTPAPRRWYYGFAGAWHQVGAAGSIDDATSPLLISESIEIPAEEDHHEHIHFIGSFPSPAEIISWRYRWRWLPLGLGYTNWNYSSARANYGNSSPGVGSLVVLLGFELELGPGGFQIRWRFENRDSNNQNVDLEARLLFLFS